MADALLALLATYLLHSTALLGAAWLLERSGRIGAVASREFVWRVALFGAVVSTTVAQLATGSADAAREAGAVPAVPVAATRYLAVSDESRFDMTLGSAPPRADGIARGTQAATAAVDVSSAGPAAVVVRRASYAVPRPSSLLASALAVLVAGIALARLAWLVRAVRDERRRALALERCTDESLLREARELARRLGAPAPALHYTEHDTGPYATGATRVCVPRWALGLDPAERRGLLAHEIAHLARRDPLWRAVCAGFARLAWIQPLNLLATRRLDDLAELACDARAADAIGGGRALASCLAACAERLFAPAPRYSAAMSRRRSSLVERVQTLLEENTMSKPHRIAFVRGAAIAALALGIVALPTIRFAAHAGERTSIEINSTFGNSTMRMKSDHLGLDVGIDGDVRFSEAEDDIVSLDDEAFIEQDVDGVERRIEFKNVRGAVEREYSVDGKVQPIDAAGRAWLASVIPTVLRESGFDAEQRVARIKARGGATAVLDEAERIRGDYARRAYLVALAESGQLAPREIDRAVAIGGRSASDFERRSSYVALVEHQELAPAQQVAILRGVAEIGSDFEQRTVLTALAPTLDLSQPVAAAWGAALAEVESDFEARTVVSAFAERDELPADALRFAFANLEEIGSDFERRVALSELAPHVARHPGMAREYAASVKSMGSDFERRTALLELIGKVPLDAGTSEAVLAAIASIGSDFEKRTTLVGLAEKMPNEPGLVRRYREITRGMGDFERIQAEKALDRFELL